MNLIAALIFFSIIVMFHELGHFLAARAVGIPVTEFAVGMGPCLFKVKGKETVYSLRMLPLGGFCRFPGEEDTEPETETEGNTEAEERTEKVEKTETGKEKGFNSQPVWKRFIVIIMGPAFNFILAFFCAAYVISQAGVDRCVLSGVVEGYPAEAAGLERGDEIIAVNSEKISFFRDLSAFLQVYPGREFDLTIRHGGDPDAETAAIPARGGDIEVVHILPKWDDERGTYMFGVLSSGKRVPAENTGALLYYAAQEVRINISLTLTAVKQLVTGMLSPDNLTGPIGIVETIGDTVEETGQYGPAVLLLNLMNLMLLISSNLGVMNLLPLGVLDGGKALLLIAEGILRRPLNRKLEEAVQFAGLGILLGLMFFAMYQDIMRLIFH